MNKLKVGGFSWSKNGAGLLLACAAVNLSAGDVFGEEACCFSDGHCEFLDPGYCGYLGATPLGPGTTCGTEQACCESDGACTDDVDPGCCTDRGGTPQGASSTCGPLEACCLPGDWTCEAMTAACCSDQEGTSKGASTTCDAEEDYRACRQGGMFCSMMDEDCCGLIGQNLLPEGEECDEFSCCFELVVAQCLDGVDEYICTWMGGIGSLPEGEACGEYGSVNCCVTDDECTLQTPQCCAEFGVVADGSCSSLEACCRADGTCEDDVLSGCCTARGGTPLGASSTCGSLEACCLPSDWSCEALTAACCSAQDGTSKGASTTCDAVEDYQACKYDGLSCDMMDADCCDAYGYYTLPPGEVCDEFGCCVDISGQALCFDDVDEDVCLLAAGLGSLPEGQACDTGSTNCCMPNDTCRVLTPDCCTELGTSITGSCWALEACCSADGSCENSVVAGCCTVRGDIPLGSSSTCAATRACCFQDRSCQDTDPDCCDANGGYAMSPGSSCGPFTCRGGQQE